MAPDDPATTVRLLWRDSVPPVSRRGPRQRISVDDVVSSALEVADEAGLAALSMRSLATRLGIGAMSLYTYVASREQLLLLMVDEALGRTPLPRHPRLPARRLRGVARLTYDEHRARPWLEEAAGVRPGLGPHAVARFEWQLRALDGLGLDDLEMDQTVTLLTGFAVQAARIKHEHDTGPGESDAEWWDAVAPTLAEVSDAENYPLADRVGNAAGQAYQAARKPDLEFEFGLDRIVDGLLLRIERGSGH